MLRFAVPVVLPPGLPDSIRTARTVAIIPARFHSTRLPGKPLALIGGKPMVEHVYNRARAASAIDAVLVATDDERVARAVDAFGGVAVMTGAHHATGTDRLAEVCRALDGDIIVNVQGDEPSIAPEAIDLAVRRLLTHADDELATLRKRTDDPADLVNPAVVKVVVNRDGYALYFTRSAVPYVRPGHPQPVFWRHLGLYAYRRDTLLTLAALPPTPLEQAEGLEQLRALEHGIRISTEETTADSIGVDTPDDLERVRQRMEAAAEA
jgi:3-deoxy-manno-octulosonate cytidylyltransferase (CMP-KDO synthetase)